MSKIKAPKDPKDLPQAIITQMLALATSGFGIVAALAWNDAVKEGMDMYIKPYLPQGSQFFSLILYAIIVTSLAVFVTLQLTKIQTFISENGSNEKGKKKTTNK